MCNYAHSACCAMIAKDNVAHVGVQGAALHMEARPTTLFCTVLSPLHCCVPCIVEFLAICSKIWSSTPPPHPPNPCISEMAFSHRFQVYTYPPPPPKGTILWCIGRKIRKPREKCQNPPSWRTMNVPERYIMLKIELLTGASCLYTTAALWLDEKQTVHHP